MQEENLDALKSIASSSKYPPELIAKIKAVKGEKGDKGDKGDKYQLTSEDVTHIVSKAKGEKGDKGDRGDKGERGFEGKSIKGDKGETGEKGDRGIQGQAGVKGLDGSPDTALGIANKLNSLKGMVNKEVIKGLPSIEEISDGLKKLTGKNKLAARDIDMTDLRWHGAGLGKVSHDSTLTGDGTPSNPLGAAGGGTGTVTSVSITTANGLAGTVSNPNTTPAISLSTTITGLLKGNGTAISAAISGTDYQAPITLTTTGSGAATFIANTLNIPTPSAGTGTVTSVTSADGNATVATQTTTPVITIVSAPKLLTARTISLTGDVTYTSGSFDGSANATGSSTVTRINGTSLAGLSTGILKNTTTTGVPSIAVAADFPILNQNTTGYANNTAKQITQTSHGFSVGQPIRYSGTTYVLSKADTSSDAEVDGMVGTVIDANNFVLVSIGYITGLTGLTAGTTYFLSAATAGVLTSTAPSTAGQISKPIFRADSTTSGYFIDYRGIAIAASANYVNVGSGTTGQYASTKFGLTDGATIALDWNNGNVQSVTLGGNRTFTFANPLSGGRYLIELIQDATGSRTITWPTIKWRGGTPPTLTTTATKTDLITLIYDGTSYSGDASLNY